MKVRVWTTLGEFVSDDISKAEILADIGGDEEVYKQKIEALIAMTSNMRELDNLTIVCGGQSTHINPAYIVAIQYSDVDE